MVSVAQGFIGIDIPQVGRWSIRHLRPWALRQYGPILRKPVVTPYSKVQDATNGSQTLRRHESTIVADELTMNRKLFLILLLITIVGIIAIVCNKDGRSLSSERYLGIKSFMIVVLLLFGKRIQSRVRRKRKPGHCRKCGYSLRGNVSGICPECGRRLQPYE